MVRAFLSGLNFKDFVTVFIALFLFIFYLAYKKDSSMVEKSGHKNIHFAFKPYENSSK